MSETTDWAAAISRQREQKDEFYAEHPHSPLPPDHRDGFDGLSYFEPDPDLRFVLPLVEDPERETITVETTTEGAREYYRWGEFRFEVDGAEQSLQAYKAEPGEGRLWVPFRDATSGEATYGAGRYLDLEAEEDRTADGEWVLDFNRAYNPYCAYSDQYECPLIPMENWLDVPIEAGEKAYEPPEGATSHAH
ncbi:MAG: DUF1684 domain-containing protein [Halobacteriales archaeon]|nr:DUF1684 domain-containing protein [Halobacteriales archaeon]